MRLKFIEQWKFRMTGRSVPVIKAEDITDDGQVRTLHFVGEVKHRDNSLVNTWDEKGWDISPDTPMITFINEKGITNNAYVVSSFGFTTPLFIKRPTIAINLEGVIGRGATVDDIADNMDVGKSNRKILIGFIMGCIVYATAIGPALSMVLK